MIKRLDLIALAIIGAVFYSNAASAQQICKTVPRLCYRPDHPNAIISYPYGDAPTFVWCNGIQGALERRNGPKQIDVDAEKPSEPSYCSVQALAVEHFIKDDGRPARRTAQALPPDAYDQMLIAIARSVDVGNPGTPKSMRDIMLQVSQQLHDADNATARQLGSEWGMP